MTQERIPSNVEGFPAFYPQLQTHPPYVDLTPEIESAPPPPSKQKPQHRSARDDRWQRECRRGLELALKRLSEKEPAGKDHIEAYLRDQDRRHLRSHTLDNTLKGVEGFTFFVQRRGRVHLEQITRQDIEAWGEHEQDRGLKASTVKMRLGLLKAFVRRDALKLFKSSNHPLRIALLDNGFEPFHQVSNVSFLPLKII